MESVLPNPKSAQLVEEYRASQEKLEKINNSLKPFTKKQIKEALDRAERERKNV